MKLTTVLIWFVFVGYIFVADLSSAQEPCDFIKSFKDSPQDSKLKNLEAEKKLGSICNQKYENVCEQGSIKLSKLYEMGFPKDDEILSELLNSDFIIWISQVDVDNDGIDEIRLFSTVGSARCTRSHFYKSDSSGQYHQLKGYEVLAEEGRFCDGNLTFIRFQENVYALEIYATIDTVWSGSQNGLRQKCSYNTAINR